MPNRLLTQVSISTLSPVSVPAQAAFSNSYCEDNRVKKQANLLLLGLTR